MPAEDIERIFAVNVFGLIAVTRAFLPLVRIARGRIVLIGSNSGFWCEPFLAAYGGAKHAVEAIGDSLRVELAPWGIEVTLIEPGMIRTPIWEKSKAATEDMVNRMPEECMRLYGEQLTALEAATGKAIRLAIPPERVAKAVCRVLEARRPKTRCRVGPDSKLQGALRHLLPDRLRDRINRWVVGV